MRVAVLGGGLSGCLTALMLAERGHAVDLIEQHAAPMMGASGNCEGKLHLGFVYALDRSRRTIGTLMRGALTFNDILGRYVGTDLLEAALSDPFLYAVVDDTMVQPDALEAHFSVVAEVYSFLREAGRVPPGIGEGPVFEPLGAKELGAIFDDRRIAAAYRTIERAVDPLPVARGLTDAIVLAPAITAIFSARVVAVAPADTGYAVTFRIGGTRATERYDKVVNAAWESRLELDRAVLPAPGRAVMHRYKAGFFADSGPGEAPPSVTFVSGPYGDLVRYRDRIYASWYPACLLSQETALAPRTPAPALDEAAVAALLEDTLAGLAALVPALTGWSVTARRWRPVGGYITSWGDSGIEDPVSELHERHRIGPHGTDTYQSIDTGKYTTAPLFAKMAARRLCGLA